VLKTNGSLSRDKPSQTWTHYEKNWTLLDFGLKLLNVKLTWLHCFL